jgi:2'-5' RNA ligase
MRLFVAIELGREIKRELAAVQVRLPAAVAKTAGLRWTNPENLHLTMKFLGEVQEVASACEAARIAAEGSAAFEMELGECGCFPPRGKVRIVYAATADRSGGLSDLASRGEAAFEAIGFPREHRPFSPHLTLGRVRDDRSAGRLRDAVTKLACKPLRQKVDSIAVMQSELLPEGPRYTRLALCAFQKSG